MAARDLTTNPVELERIKINDKTIKSTYKTGYGNITVRSVFGTKLTYADLLCKIIATKIESSQST